MRKLSFLILIVLAMVPTSRALAQEVINAGLLPVVWYSDTTIYAGEEVNIYGGMQNHSTSTVEAQVVFLVDGEPVSTAKFVSKPDTLIELEGKWVATSGNHKIRLHITSSKPDNLLSRESEEVSLSVKTPVTVAKVKEVASETAESLVSSIDTATESLSNKILELKKPIVELVVESDTAEVETLSGVPTDVEGTTNTPNDIARSASNLALTFLASSVLHWKLTLAGIVLLILILKFTS